MSDRRKRSRLAVEDGGGAGAVAAAVCYAPSAASTSSTHGLQYSMYAKDRVQVVQASVTECVSYRGRSDGSENAGVQSCSYALAVFLPDEGRLKLLDVAGDRVFRLDGRVEGLRYAPAAADADAELARREASKRLVDAFGSTRRRRQLSAREVVVKG
jgi:hypothetical protein